jgi:hypothetical protein
MCAAHLDEPLSGSLGIEKSKVDCGLVHEGAVGRVRETGKERGKQLGRALGR